MSSSSDENDSSSPQESSSDAEELHGVVYGQYEPYAHRDKFLEENIKKTGKTISIFSLCRSVIFTK